MPSSAPSIIHKLSDLRDVTKLTGTLDELQVRNLQMWGRIAFPQAQKFGLNWDGNARTVEYDYEPAPGRETPHNFSAYLQALDTSCKDLLGDEWLLTVKRAGAVEFTGMRKQAFQPPRGSLDQVPGRGEMEFDVRGKQSAG